MSSYPVWKINNNDILTTYVARLASLTYELEQLDAEIQRQLVEVNALQRRHSVIINNIIADKFDFDTEQQYALIYKDELHIYPLDKSTNLIDHVVNPSPLFVLNINAKQSEHIHTILNDYLSKSQDLLQKNSHSTLLQYSVLSLQTEIEEYLTNPDLRHMLYPDATHVFNPEQHRLVIVYDSEKMWGLEYIQKEDVDAYEEQQTLELHKL